MQRNAVSAGPLVTVAVLFLTALMGAAIVKTDGLALVIIPASLGGLLIILRPELGLVFMAFLLPFEDALMFGGGSTITKAAGVLVAGAWVLQKLIRRESWRRLVTSAPLGLVALLIGFALLSMVWAEWPQVVFPRVVRLIMLFAFCLLALDLTRRWRQLEWIARALVCGGTVAAVMVILQYATGSVRRAGGSVAGDVNSTAMMLVVLVPFAFALIRTRGGLIWRLLGLAYLGLAVVAVGQTLSRMSYLMLVLVLTWEVWMALRTRRSRLVAVLVLALTLGLGIRFLPLDVIQERAQTIVPYIETTLSADATGSGALSGRGFHLRVAMTIFQDHPFIGVGYANFGRYFLQYQFEVAGAGGMVYMSPRSAHSAYMALLADLGLVGAVLSIPFLFLVCRGLFQSYRRLRTGDEQRKLLLGRAIGVSFAIFLAYGFYAEFQLQKLFWLLAGLALSLDLLSSVSPPGSPGAPAISSAPGKSPRLTESGQVTTLLQGPDVIRDSDSHAPRLHS